MKKILLVLASATLVLFSSCRHDDFDLLRHPVHVQGSANVHLGTPVGNGEMSIDDLFNMINDSTINNMMDTGSNVITLSFETSIDTTVSGSSMNINFKNIAGKMKVGELPWGRNKVSRRWQPIRRSGDRKWSPTRSQRITAAKNGAYKSKDATATVDNIFTYSDTISYALNLDMLSSSSFFNDADFELDSVGLSFSMTLRAVCNETARQYLDNYVTFTVDSVMIFYTTEDGTVHQYNEAPFDGSTEFIYGHDSPTHIGITQQDMVISFPNANIAPVVNAKPKSIRARFRFKLDVARAMVLDVVARPEFDTTGFYLTGLDLNTITLDDVSDFDTATLMGNIRNNLANIDTLKTINYLFFGANWQNDPNHIDTTNPQTILNFLNIDTAFVLDYLGIDTTKPRTVLYAAGYSDTSDIGLAAGANLPLDTLGTGEVVFDTCELIRRATNNKVSDCDDTNGLIAAITHDSGYHNNALDTNYFIKLLTGNPNLTMDSTVAILNWIGIDTSESNLGNIMLDAGIDTSDEEGLIYAATGHHLITSEDTTWFLQQVLGNSLSTTEDTNNLVHQILGNPLDTNALVSQITGHPWNDTNYYLQQITGNPTITQNDTNELLVIATGYDTSQTEEMFFAATGLNTTDTCEIIKAALHTSACDTSTLIRLATNNTVTGVEDTCGIMKAATNNAITGDCHDTTQYMTLFGIDTAAIVASIDTASIVSQFDTATIISNIDTAGIINWSSFYGLTPAQIQAKKDHVMDSIRNHIMDSIRTHVMDSVRAAVKADMQSRVTDSITNRVTNYLSTTVSPFLEDSVKNYVERKISHYVSNSVTGYFNTRIQNYVTNTVKDYVVDTVMNYVIDTLSSYFKDQVAGYVEETLGDYLRETITDTVKARIQRNIVPRMKDYIITEVTDYVTKEVLKAYKEPIFDYLKEQVMNYVTETISDTLQAYLNDRIENFTSLKDTLTGIMNNVAQSNYNCNASVAVNVPFQMKIGSLAYPLDVELWKDGQNPIDVDAILNKLPNFLDASLDDSYFNMKVSNGMPLEFVVNAELLDANKLPLCTLIENDTIKAAQMVQDVNNPTCWEASDTTISVIRATMNQEKLKKIKNSKYVRMNLVLSSNNRFVYVKRTDKMAFRAFLQANANANVDLPVPHTPLPIPSFL